MVGVVYILQEDYSNRYKIGKTTNIGRRLDDFVVSLPFKIKLVHVIENDNIDLLETYLHRYFRKKRVNGEWFELTDEDILWIKVQDFKTLFSSSGNKTEFDSGKRIRVNPQLDQKTHDGLRDLAYKLNTTKTTLAGEIIRFSLQDEEFIKFIEFYLKNEQRNDQAI